MFLRVPDWLELGTRRILLSLLLAVNAYFFLVSQNGCRLDRTWILVGIATLPVICQLLISTRITSLRRLSCLAVVSAIGCAFYGVQHKQLSAESELKRIGVQLELDHCRYPRYLSALRPDSMKAPRAVSFGPDTTSADIDDAIPLLSCLPYLQEFWLESAGTPTGTPDRQRTVAWGDGTVYSSEIRPETILAVSRLRRLKRLRIDGCIVQQRELEQLLSLPRLEQLSFSRCLLPSGAYERLGRCSNLRELQLDFTGIRDQDLAQIVRMPNLRVLSVCMTHVTNQCFSHLRSSRSLRTIYIIAPGVSSDDLAEYCRTSTTSSTLGAQVPTDWGWEEALEGRKRGGSYWKLVD